MSATGRGGFRPEVQCKQFVAVVDGEHGSFNVYTTGSDRHYLFRQLDAAGQAETGLEWPVAKADLRDDVRHGLAHGVGYRREVTS